MMGSRNKEEVAGQCVRSSEVRGREWLWGTVTTDHTNVSLEAAMQLSACLCVGVGASGSRL